MDPLLELRRERGTRAMELQVSRVIPFPVPSWGGQPALRPTLKMIKPFEKRPNAQAVRAFGADLILRIALLRERLMTLTDGTAAGACLTAAHVPFIATIARLRPIQTRPSR